MTRFLKFSLISLTCISCFSIVSCTDDTPSDDNNSGNPQEDAISIVSKSNSFSVSQLDTLYLSVSSSKELEGYTWIVDGEEVSSEKEMKFTRNKTGNHKLQFKANDLDGNEVVLEQELSVTGRFSKGTFILNEGNMSDETGTLTFIDETGIAIDSAYYRVNGTLLGNVCQDMFIADNKIYVISENGAMNGGEGKLIVMQADNLEKIKVYNDELASLSRPTNLAVVGSKVYIRNSRGIYGLDTETGELAQIGKFRPSEKRMAVIDGKVFAEDGSKILVIEKDGTAKEVDLERTISGISRSYDGNLWVSCTSPANAVIKLNPADCSIMEEHETAEKIGAGWGVAPAFSAVQDTIYFSNATSKLYRHIFKENKTEYVIDVKDYIPDFGTYYNSLGVNPSNGQVCFATIKGYGPDYKTNDIALFDFNKENPLIADFKSMNSFPAGVFYTYNFE